MCFVHIVDWSLRPNGASMFSAMWKMWDLNYVELNVEPWSPGISDVSQGRVILLEDPAELTENCVADGRNKLLVRAKTCLFAKRGLCPPLSVTYTCTSCLSANQMYSRTLMSQERSRNWPWRNDPTGKKLWSNPNTLLGCPIPGPLYIIKIN